MKSRHEQSFCVCLCVSESWKLRRRRRRRRRNNNDGSGDETSQKCSHFMYFFIFNMTIKRYMYFSFSEVLCFFLLVFFFFDFFFSSFRSFFFLLLISLNKSSTLSKLFAPFNNQMDKNAEFRPRCYCCLVLLFNSSSSFCSFVVLLFSYIVYQKQ